MTKKELDQIFHTEFLYFAVSNKEIQEAFQKDKGMNIRSLIGRSGIETIIDEATGYDKKVMTAFIVWVTEKYWNSPKNCEHIELYQRAKEKL